MISLNSSSFQSRQSSSPETRITSSWSRSQRNSLTQVRLRILVSQKLQNQSVLARLVLDYGVTVNITGANFGKMALVGWLDLELRGNISQLQKALDYLQQLDLKIVGKANPDGDSW